MLVQRGRSVVSRQSVPGVRIAGLERAARFAGESFGHEEATFSVAENRVGGSAAVRLGLWITTSLAAVAGLSAIGMHLY